MQNITAIPETKIITKNVFGRGCTPDSSLGTNITTLPKHVKSWRKDTINSPTVDVFEARFLMHILATSYPIIIIIIIIIIDSAITLIIYVNL